jgi:hypothetical protein
VRGGVDALDLPAGFQDKCENLMLDKTARLVGAMLPPRRVRALAVKPKRDVIPTFRL